MRARPMPMLGGMRLPILNHSRYRLNTRRWRDRSRRFTAVHSALEALWSQGLALRMSLPEPRTPDESAQSEEPDTTRDRAHATLRQWRSFVGVFLFENVCADRLSGEFAADEIPADVESLDSRLREIGAEAVYDACLDQLADVACAIQDEHVLPVPRLLDDAAETCDAPLEAVLAIKLRGIPRIA